MSIKQKITDLKELRQEYLTHLAEYNELVKTSHHRKVKDCYVKYLENEKVVKNTILYESNYGKSIVDNPYALFKHIIQDSRYSGFNHFWVIKNADVANDIRDAIPSLFDRDNVHFVKYESEEYLYALATCQYLFNNLTFMSYFVKRPEQVYVNTWHGVPLKSMGFDMKDGIEASRNVVRNFLLSDYLLADNQVMVDMYMNSYKLAGVYAGTILKEGYPRTDLAYHTSRKHIGERFKSLGIEVDPAKRIVLYAPTWKSADHSNSSIHPECDPDALLAWKSDLEKLIDCNTYQVLIKPHQFTYDLIASAPQYNGLFIPPSIDANEILGATDILISDFSSIVFDYLALDRPIILYSKEEERYSIERGITLSLAGIVGPCACSISEVASYIHDICCGIDEYAESRFLAKNDYCAFDDGSVCARITDIILGKSKPQQPVSNEIKKKRMLLFGGNVCHNGITRALIALLRQLDYSKWDVTLSISEGKAELSMFLQSIPSEVRVLLYTGTLLATADEAARRETLDKHLKTNPIAKALYPKGMFTREYARLFGATQFDCAIDYNGYERIGAGIIATCNASKKLIWLHNDMYADSKKCIAGELKHETNLNFVFSLWPRFDFLVSCTKETSKVNRRNMEDFSTKGKFTYASNCIDIQRVEEGLSTPAVTIDGDEYYIDKSVNGFEDTTLIRLPKPSETAFVTMGRLSPEKNQEALIRAFAKLHDHNANVYLYLLGDGPLRQHLEDVTAQLGVSDSVRFLGNLDNPFAFMKRCSCFVFPSLYEGQGLVVMEARMCGLPIILSKFEAVDSVSIEGGQLIVGFDENALLDGMKAYLNDEVPRASFNAQEYNDNAYAEFEATLA